MCRRNLAVADSVDRRTETLNVATTAATGCAVMIGFAPSKIQLTDFLKVPLNLTAGVKNQHELSPRTSPNKSATLLSFRPDHLCAQQ